MLTDIHWCLLEIAEKWNQPKYPPNDEQINENVAHTHNGILFSCKEKQNLQVSE